MRVTVQIRCTARCVRLPRRHLSNRSSSRYAAVQVFAAHLCVVSGTRAGSPARSGTTASRAARNAHRASTRSCPARSARTRGRTTMTRARSTEGGGPDTLAPFEKSADPTRIRRLTQIAKGNAPLVRRGVWSSELVQVRLVGLPPADHGGQVVPPFAACRIV